MVGSESATLSGATFVSVGTIAPSGDGLGRTGDKAAAPSGPRSTRVIDLVQFRDESAIDPKYVACTYYLAPDGKTAADASAVVQLNCSIPFPRQHHYTFDDWSDQLH